MLCGEGTSEKCYTLLDDSLLPISDTFKRTPGGIATYTYESGKAYWGEISEDVLVSIDENLLNIKRCAANVLNADIFLAVEPEVQQIFPRAQNVNQFILQGMYSPAKGPGEALSFMGSKTAYGVEDSATHYFDVSPDDLDTPGIEVGEYGETQMASCSNLEGRRILYGTIPKDFMLIFVVTDIRFSNGAEGITVRNAGRLVVSVNRLGDLLEHELGIYLQFFLT